MGKSKNSKSRDSKTPPPQAVPVELPPVTLLGFTVGNLPDPILINAAYDLIYPRSREPLPTICAHPWDPKDVLLVKQVPTNLLAHAGRLQPFKAYCSRCERPHAPSAEIIGFPCNTNGCPGYVVADYCYTTVLAHRQAALAGCCSYPELYGNRTILDEGWHKIGLKRPTQEEKEQAVNNAGWLHCGWAWPPIQDGTGPLVPCQPYRIYMRIEDLFNQDNLDIPVTSWCDSNIQLARERMNTSTFVVDANNERPRYCGGKSAQDPSASENIIRRYNHLHREANIEGPIAPTRIQYTDDTGGVYGTEEFTTVLPGSQRINPGKISATFGHKEDTKDILPMPPKRSKPGSPSSLGSRSAIRSPPGFEGIVGRNNRGGKSDLPSGSLTAISTDPILLSPLPSPGTLKLDYASSSSDSEGGNFPRIVVYEDEHANIQEIVFSDSEDELQPQRLFGPERPRTPDRGFVEEYDSEGGDEYIYAPHVRFNGVGGSLRVASPALSDEEDMEVESGQSTAGERKEHAASRSESNGMHSQEH